MAMAAGGIGAGIRALAGHGGRRTTFSLPRIAGARPPYPIVHPSFFTMLGPAGYPGAGRIRLPGECSHVETN